MCSKNLMKRFLVIAISLLECSAAVQAASDEQDARLLDELIGKHVSPVTAPGAVAALVRRDGRVTLRGYGMADSANQRGADPENTVFRIGSISKTFTAVAIMQLVDEGKIALEENANKYLKGVQIPNGGVRVLDLLTHRGGFDGDITFVGLDDRVAATQSSDARLQRDILSVRPPGLLPSYDNLAWGLLGHIVESVDGVAYSQAMKKRIFEPLGMKNTAVGLPLDESNVAVPYEVGSDGMPHQKRAIFLRRGWQGAGDISTTAADMAYFLQAMLNEGAYPGGRLMKAATFRRQTDTTGFGFHPGVQSIGLGVYSLTYGFGHGGTIRGFNASLVVMPAQGIAAFAVMNLNNPVPEMSLSGLMNYLSTPSAKVAFDPTDFMTAEFPYLLQKSVLPASALATPAPVPGDEPDWSGRYSGLRPGSYEALLPRLATAVFLKPKVVRREVDGKLFIGANGPYARVAKGLYSSGLTSGPLITSVGFAEYGGEVLMGAHTLQASRRLAWYERPGLTVAGLLVAPILILIAALCHQFMTDTRQRRRDWILAGSALLLLLGIGAEVALATRLHRIEDLGWIVSAWRVGMGGALLAMLAAALFGMRHAFISDATNPSASQPGRAYSCATGLLAVWVVLAAMYWHVPGQIY
jgi:CubicO group peptidase (beta-lactamase class C family)